MFIAGVVSADSADLDPISPPSAPAGNDLDQQTIAEYQR